MRAVQQATAIRPVAAIPRWIFFFGGFLALFGLAATAQYALTPTTMFPGLSTDIPGAQAAAYATAARAFAQAVALGLALIFRARVAIGIVLVMRAITEVLDLVTSLVTGVMPMPLAALLIFFAVIIGLELFAAYTLLRRGVV